MYTYQKKNHVFSTRENKFRNTLLTCVILLLVNNLIDFSFLNIFIQCMNICFFFQLKSFQNLTESKRMYKSKRKTKHLNKNWGKNLDISSV